MLVMCWFRYVFVCVCACSLACLFVWLCMFVRLIGRLCVCLLCDCVVVCLVAYVFVCLFACL